MAQPPQQTQLQYVKFNIIGTNLLTKKNAPPPVSHVFQPTDIMFELIYDIIGMNLLTKFHEDRTVNRASRVLTRLYYSHIRKNAPPLGSHFFQANIIIFNLIQYIIETNLLTIFHEDWTINVASRVLTRKNAPPMFYDDKKINVTSRVLTSPAPVPCGGLVFQPTVIIFELDQDIIGINLLTEFHEDQTINVASNVKNAPPLSGHVYQANVTIFELIQDIIKTNLLTIFYQDWTIHVASRPRSHGGHVFQPTGIIFLLIHDIIGMNLLTEFHEDRTLNMASRVKNAPPLGGHVFQANVTIFELIQDIIKTNLLTRKNAPPPGGHFHEDWTIIVASRVHLGKNAQPLGSHVFKQSGTNLLSKFHEDQKINVASKMLTRKNAPPPGGHIFQPAGIIF
ncbi:hypothetical protein DPMN_152347 [Dreissena polymorpha]|uniref:Uncharacterized protein n=1 Tax=Dreissena polymorpha TaxID=45954 RepID=A0A9D4FGP0_DREPO|nr:hypothetical protein DPMN_152347 [Dreissena polymorpha]